MLLALSLLASDPDALLRKVFNDPDRPTVVLGDTSTPRVPIARLRGTLETPVVTCFTEAHGTTLKQWCEVDYGPGHPPVVVGR